MPFYNVISLNLLEFKIQMKVKIGKGERGKGKREECRMKRKKNGGK